jgi:predicted permease
MNIVSILLPLFLLIAAGAGYRLVGGRVGPEKLTDLIMNILMPCLIFDALLKAQFTAGRLGKLALANVILVLTLFAICRVFRALVDLPPSFELPVLFMNAGFLGIPLMQFYGGEPAVASIVIFDQVQSLFIFTLGLWLMTAHLSIAEQLLSFAREPIVWAILLGFGLSHFGGSPAFVPEEILGSIGEVIELTGSATIPLALFLLGYDLHRFQPKLDGAVWSTVALRLGLGSLLGIGVCVLLNLRGPDGAAVLLGAGLPSAVFSYVLAQRYDKAPSFAAGAVFYTSVFTIATLPVMLYLAYEWYPPTF